MPLDGSSFAQTDPAIQKLDRVIALIDDPAKWVQGTLSLRDDGARRYCILGAIQAAGAEQLMPAIVFAMREEGYRAHATIMPFNDSPARTHAEVMRVLYRTRDNLIFGVGPQVRPAAVRRLAARRGWVDWFFRILPYSIAGSAITILAGTLAGF